MKRALVIQTAFLGDVILTLPLIQVLKKFVPDMQIDFLVIPETADIVQSHPAVSELIIFDKHGRHKSVASFLSFRKKLRQKKYDIVLSPHRSLRSCLLAKGTEAQVRIGFDSTALKRCFTDLLPWEFGVHDIERNLSLLSPLGIRTDGEAPRLYPTDENRREIDAFFVENKIELPFAAIAPGTVWKTKRYPVEMMSEVSNKLLDKFASVILIGGKKDISLFESFGKTSNGIVSAIGKFPMMSSAEIIRRASLLVANDSAPIHVASAFNVPTVAIFGPTVRAFGFFPYHEKSVVVEVENLSCRPCTLHGGNHCPIGTFECMKRIRPEEVVEKGLALLEKHDG